LPAAFRGRGEALDVTTATTGVAGRYASALFELADGSKSLDQVAQDLDTFRKMVAESTDLARLIASPVIPRALQGKALLAVLDAAGISGLTRNFVGTVAANGRARDLPAMASAFLAELAARRGETTATVTSEISAILKDQIKNFGKEAEVSEVGQVLSVGDGIARVYGLDNVQAGEMVEFPGGIRAWR
jgi:F-type H+-transporting ATPase subunit delta